MELQEKTDKLQKLFQKVDQQTHDLSCKASLHCLPGCGACCENPNVESTVLEFLPLSIELWQKNQSEDLLRLLNKTEEGTSCILYKADPNIPGNGRCTQYELRPLLCRTFGYAARLNKYGEKELATCKKISLDQPESIKRAQKLIDEGLDVPVFSEAWLALLDIDPGLATDRYPMNVALKTALEKIGYWRDCSQSDTLENHDYSNQNSRSKKNLF